MKVKELQLAQLVESAPEGDEWLHEQKFDGYRIVADLDGRTRLLSRRFNDWTAQFPAVVDALADLPVKRAVFDGEVCVVMPDGRTSFQALQNAFGRRDANVVYYVFDLLELDGRDLMKLPLEQRKEKLKEIVGSAKGTIRYSDHVIGNGREFFTLACKQGLEGIISKRRDKPYLPGRGSSWVKTKCLQRHEFVIGGYTDPEGSRTHIGALLVGYHDDEGNLVYAGKVGTGFSMKALAELRAGLEPHETETCPFTPVPQRAWTGPNRHWVAPVVVAEVAFSEWTDDGRLRHPSFQGLRIDKAAKDVVRERPKPYPKPQ